MEAKVHYYVHIGLPMDTMLSQLNPIHTLKHSSFKTCLNIIIYTQVSQAISLPQVW
jgi:hypothetical protein